jgi:DNA (cytosine-5)-methyltransferase 1
MAEQAAVLYNEIAPYPAQWLRRLIAAGQHPPGRVAECSISDVTAPPQQFHAFAGIGLWSHALKLAGWPARTPVWTGSCPCQPFSSASRGRSKRFNDSRDTWPHWRELIIQHRPAVIFGEQVAGPGGAAWLERTATDLQSIGYAFGSALLCASLLGFPRRRRFYFVAHTDFEGQRAGAEHAEVASVSPASWMAPEHGLQPRAVDADGDGNTGRMARLRAYGNAIVPQVAAYFVRAYMIRAEGP